MATNNLESKAKTLQGEKTETNVLESAIKTLQDDGTERKLTEILESLPVLLLKALSTSNTNPYIPDLISLESNFPSALKELNKSCHEQSQETIALTTSNEQLEFYTKSLSKLNKLKVKTHTSATLPSAFMHLVKLHTEKLSNHIKNLLKNLSIEEKIFKAYTKNKEGTEIFLNRDRIFESPRNSSISVLLFQIVERLTYNEAKCFLEKKLTYTQKHLCEFNREFLSGFDLQQFGITNLFYASPDEHLNRKLMRCIIIINIDLNAGKESLLLNYIRSSHKEFLSIRKKIENLLNGPEPDKAIKLIKSSYNNPYLKYFDNVNISAVQILNNPQKETVIHTVKNQLQKQSRLKNRQKGSKTKTRKTVLINQHLLNELINTKLYPNGVHQKYSNEKSKSLVMVINNFLRKNNTEIKQAIEAYRPDMDITEKAQKRKTDFTISKKTDAVLKKLAKNHEISLQNLLHILLFYAVQEVRALAIQRYPGIENARNHSETQLPVS